MLMEMRGNLIGIIRTAGILTAGVCVLMLALLPLFGGQVLLASCAGLLAGGCGSLGGYLLLRQGVLAATGAYGRRSAFPVVLSFVGRLLVYGGVLVGMAYALGLPAALGAAAGLLTVPAAVLLRGARGAKGAASSTRYVYDEELRDRQGKRRHLFIHSHSRDLWRGGRHYVTHKKFRVLRGIRQVQDGRIEGKRS